MMKIVNGVDVLPEVSILKDGAVYPSQVNQIERLSKIIKSAVGFELVFALFNDTSYRDLIINKITNHNDINSVVVNVNFVNYPHFDIDVNFKGTINIVLASLEAKVRRFLYASSLTIY